MDVLKFPLLNIFILLLLNEVGTNYAYNNYYDDFRPIRRPTHQIGRAPYSIDPFPPLGPLPARRPGPNFYDVIPQDHPLWSQFWDVYNYRGPLEEHPSTFYENRFNLDGNYYRKPDDFFQQRIPHVSPSIGTTRADAYKKYREYFGRRYGTRFDD